MDPEAEQALTDGDLASVDDIWLKPVLVPRIRLRMRNLLSKSKRVPTPPSTCSGWTPDRQHAGSCLVPGYGGVHHKVNSGFANLWARRRDKGYRRHHSRIWNTPEGRRFLQGVEQAAIEAGSTVLADEIVKSGAEKHLFKTYKTPLRVRTAKSRAPSAWARLGQTCSIWTWN